MEIGEKLNEDINRLAVFFPPTPALSRVAERSLCRIGGIFYD